MTRGAQFIEHKEKKIYFVDYTHIKSNREFLQVIESTNAFRENLVRQGEKDLLMLVDVTGSYVFGEVFDALKQSGRLTQPIVRKEALVGITWSQRLMLEIIKTFTRMQFKVFATVPDALDWLIDEAKV